MKQDVSNELLGAFVDHELACSDKRTLAEEIRTNPEMADRAQALLDLKSAIKQAYPDTVTVKDSRETSTSKLSGRFFKQSIAASVIMTCGLLLGALFNPADFNGHQQSVAAGDSLFGIKVNPVTHDDNKVLLHVSTSELDKLDFLLTKTERLLLDSKTSNHPLNIEVIANSKGIDLLRKGTTPYAKRIMKLQQQYENLQFIACKNTIQRLKKSGQNVQMIEGVNSKRPALDTIINRMDKGWTYVKI